LDPMEIAMKLVERSWRQPAAFLALFILVLLPLSGCADKAMYRMAAESGWDRWEEDHRKVVSDEEYMALPDTPGREMYMPQSLFNARRFEKKQALGLLKD